jgi:hypothetical protein
MLPRLHAARVLAAAAQRLPPAEARAYRQGYSSGWATCDLRWRKHAARVDLAPLARRRTEGDRG